uniref:(California timema) hypothetical protein n=1 Tax=Timema californicum TaxID=61474 RepID=A0A7R9JJU6_TIMCA|nr:unnamed protein product [Timema californicum]
MCWCKQDLGRYSGRLLGSADVHQHLSTVDLIHGFYSGSKMYPGQILFLLLSCFILPPPCPALPDVIPIVKSIGPADTRVRPANIVSCNPFEMDHGKHVFLTGKHKGNMKKCYPTVGQ